MLSTFTINGMTCQGCKFKVQHLLQQINGVNRVEVDVEKNSAFIESEQQISNIEIEIALKEYPKYTLANSLNVEPIMEENKTWWNTYKPVLLIFIYLILTASFYEIKNPDFNTMRWMNHFMAGFFLIFSFFKLLNVNAFANSYAMYDVVAKRVSIWGKIYPFVELGLGLCFLFNIKPLVVNWVTLIVMSVSLIGVLQSVLNKKKIKCACLGTVFNFPMSTVTIIEDGLMILMSVYMLVSYYF
jgi:copper chaperone CopZ